MYYSILYKKTFSREVLALVQSNRIVAHVGDTLPFRPPARKAASSTTELAQNSLWVAH